MMMDNREELSKVHREILDYFIEICDTYNLRWCLAYGTLLGVIRENGFIPWDYDADVFMPIDDYRKLYALCKEGKIFNNDIRIALYDNFDRYMRNFKMVKMNTTIATTEHVIGHIFIDIFPLFDFNNCDETINMIYNISRYFKNEWLGSFRNKEKIKNGNVELFEGILQGISNAQNNVNSSVDIEELIGYGGGIGNITIDRVKKYMMPKIEFENQLQLDFEGLSHKARIPKNYDKVLKSMYGDYKKPVVFDRSIWLFDANTDCSVYKKSGTLPNTRLWG